MKKSLMLAPMAELSHRALRELIEDYGGADEYFGEMASAGAICGGGPFEKYYLDSGPAPERFVYQLCGSTVQAIRNAAAFLNSRDCLGIDINMGCCAPAIYRHGGGAAWMRSADEAGRLIAAVRPVVKKRLSVKLRIGETDDFENLLRFCRRLESEGVELITLHGRTIKEKFKGVSRWASIERLQASLGIQVAGNGDITDMRNLAMKAETSHCAALMLGRLAVKEPWIFGMYRRGAAAYSKPDLEAAALRFLDYLAQYQPPQFHYSRARRFFAYFFANIQWAEYMRNRVNREKTLAGMERVIKEYFRAEAAS